MSSILQCMDCGQQYPSRALMYTCGQCGGLLDVQHDLDMLRNTIRRDTFDQRLGALEPPYNSGVWRYKELVYPDVDNATIVSRPEGNTNLYHTPKLAEWAGVRTLYLKHEGENPTGSFKDRGMTGGLTQARVLGVTRVACASTGNTSASMAAYAALAGIEGVVFFQNREIALGKLSQAIAYGATCIQVNADFDRNLQLVREISQELGIYVLNSINPFRLEGQKTIIIEALQQLHWQTPDWIVCPGGNLGNSSAIGKALHELHHIGLIDRMPRLAIIQAEGANPLYRSYQTGFARFEPVRAQTIATAIRVGNPASWQGALAAREESSGVIEAVTDDEILEAYRLLAREAGIFGEPAAAASVAGLFKMAQQGLDLAGKTAVCVITGSGLKDPETALKSPSDMRRLPADPDLIEKALGWA